MSYPTPEDIKADIDAVTASLVARKAAGPVKYPKGPKTRGFTVKDQVRAQQQILLERRARNGYQG